MAIADSIIVVRPGQTNNLGSTENQFTPQQTGLLREQFSRSSVLEPMFEIKKTMGVNGVIMNASGTSQVMSRAIAGKDLDGSTHAWGKTQLTVAGRIYCREAVEHEEMMQAPYDVLSALARSQGQAMARISDQAFAIAAVRAGLSTVNTYGLAAGKGLDPATQVTLASAGAANDPAALYAGLIDLLTGMSVKDVDAGMLGVKIIVSPTTLGTLRMHDYLINSDYKTSEGDTVSGMVLRASAFGGVPIVASNNFVGGKVITAFPLNNAYNNYDGDFTKVVAVAVGPQSILAGETGSLQAMIWENKEKHLWSVDAFRTFDVKPDQVATSGALLIP